MNTREEEEETASKEEELWKREKQKKTYILQQANKNAAHIYALVQRFCCHKRTKINSPDQKTVLNNSRRELIRCI